MQANVPLNPRVGRAIGRMDELMKLINTQITYIYAHKNDVSKQMQRLLHFLMVLFVSMVTAVRSLRQRNQQGTGYQQWEGICREMRFIYRLCNNIILDVGCWRLGSLGWIKISKDDLKLVKDELGLVRDEEWLLC